MGLLVSAAIVLVGLISLVSGWPPTVACGDDRCKEAREWAAFSLSLLVVLGGAYQYW